MRKKIMVVVAEVVLVSLVFFFLRPESRAPASADVQKKEQSSKNMDTNSIANLSDSGIAERHRSRRAGVLFNHGSSTNQVVPSKKLTAEEQERLNEAFEITEKLNVLLDEGDDAEALQEARKLITNPNPEVRMAVLQALKWIGTPAAADLASLTGDADPEISQTANEAFWDTIDEIDDPQLTIEMLKIPLQSPSSAMRQEAVDRLVFLPEQLAFPVIASMLNDSDVDVRNLAKDNLEFISSEEFDSEAQAMAWFNIHRDELEQLDAL